MLRKEDCIKNIEIESILVKLKQNLGNIIFFIVLVFLIIKKSPEVIKMHNVEGTKFNSIEIQDLKMKKLILPVPKHKQVLLFWATWCGPCQIELARINKLIKEGYISKESVLAISIGEEFKTVSQFVNEKKYIFSVGIDVNEKVAQMLNIKSTPTLLFVDEAGEIMWMTSGLSPSLEIRILYFLKNMNLLKISFLNSLSK